MKNWVAFLAIAFLGVTPLTAQILDPVQVKHSFKHISDTEVELQVTAIMEEGWHIYSVRPEEKSFVVFTEFNVPKNEHYRKIGAVNEPKPKKEYDPNFEETLKFHENTVTFTQKIKLLSQEDFKITAEFVYQTCNSEICLTPVYEDLEYHIHSASKVNSAKP
jgi:thiol:disulfide interchange protein DsbD